MHENFPGKGVATGIRASIGPVTRWMVRDRARELAVIAGRSPPHVTQGDYEDAKRELTGETEMDRQDAILDALPENKRWDPVPGSAGHQAPESPDEDEDADGQNKSAQLVDSGAAEAERNRAQRATHTRKKTSGHAP